MIAVGCGSQAELSDDLEVDVGGMEFVRVGRHLYLDIEAGRLRD